MRKRVSEIGNTGGDFPVAKTHCTGERSTRSAVCTSFASSLAAALLGTRRVSARWGWAGKKSGLFEHPARGSPVVLDVRAIEFPPCHNSFAADS